MSSTWEMALEVAAREFEKPDYSLDPARWVKDKLGEHLWSAQRAILDSVRVNRYTAVPSCHDSGKSYTASRVAAMWLETHPPGEAFVVTTAPSAAQVYAILWREITKAHTKGKLFGRIITSGYPQWKMDNGELIAYGRKPADYEESAFQGIHARYVLVIIDEAGGVDRALYDQVDALVTNENARVLAIGNPDDPSSHFAQICKPNSGWNVIRIDGLRTPNFTRELVESTYCSMCDGPPQMLMRLMAEEDIPYVEEEVPHDIRPLLLSPLWAEERLHRWVGEPGIRPDGTPETISSKAAASPLFPSKVRGLFPDSSSEGVIPLSWIERAIDRWRDWVLAGKPEQPGRRITGVDVARFGDDNTAIYCRQGVAPIELQEYSHKDTMETVALVEPHLLSAPQTLAVVDVIGVGAGVVDRLRERSRKHKYGVIAFSGAESAKDRRDHTGKMRFTNVRAAAWWNLRELLDPTQPGGARVMLPDHEGLKADLTTPRWKPIAGGLIWVEPKEEYKKRLGRSPDVGDAVVMSWWVEGGPMPDTGGDGTIRGPGLAWFNDDNMEIDARPTVIQDGGFAYQIPDEFS